MCWEEGIWGKIEVFAFQQEQCLEELVLMCEKVVSLSFSHADVLAHRGLPRGGGDSPSTWRFQVSPSNKGQSVLGQKMIESEALEVAGGPDFIESKEAREEEKIGAGAHCRDLGYLIRVLGSSDFIREEHWSVENEGVAISNTVLGKSPLQGPISWRNEGCCLRNCPLFPEESWNQHGGVSKDRAYPSPMLAVKTQIREQRHR